MFFLEFSFEIAMEMMDLEIPMGSCAPWFCCHGGFGYHSFHSGIPFVRIVMEVVCDFFFGSLVVIPFFSSILV